MYTIFTLYIGLYSLFIFKEGHFKYKLNHSILFKRNKHHY